MQKVGEDIDAQMSIEERKQMISTREDAWRTKGRGAANDSTQYTVAARMVKKGQCKDASVCNAASKETWKREFKELIIKK